MALDKFRAPPLVYPPVQYSQEYMAQTIRTLEIYFNQLDSATPNHAETYTATYFYGEFRGTFQNIASADMYALSAGVGQIVYNTDENKLFVYTLTGWEMLYSHWIARSLSATGHVGTVTVTTV